jgi:hypothetical protein
MSDLIETQEAGGTQRKKPRSIIAQPEAPSSKTLRLALEALRASQDECDWLRRALKDANAALAAKG